MANPNIIFRSIENPASLYIPYVLDQVPKEQYQRYAEALLKYSKVAFLILGVKDQEENIIYSPFIGNPLPSKPENITWMEEYVFGSHQLWNTIPTVEVASYNYCSILFKRLQNEVLLQKIRSNFKCRVYKDIDSFPNYSAYKRFLNPEKYYCYNCRASIEWNAYRLAGKCYCKKCFFRERPTTKNQVAEKYYCYKCRVLINQTIYDVAGKYYCEECFCRESQTTDNQVALKKNQVKSKQNYCGIETRGCPDLDLGKCILCGRSSVPGSYICLNCSR